ncbi:MAG TPA: pyruvate dehydrogenase (acetyl-transferring) E1 component subunit alpha [Candidatus Obscuribacterales bacterium]
MPRKPLDIPLKLETISVLDENGEVDKSLEPKIPNDELKNWYRWMLMGRRVDERLLKLQRQGRIGTFPQASGHEAIALGTIVAIEKPDWFVPAYRETTGFLYRGWTIETILLYWSGLEEGAIPPEGMNDLPIAVPVATQLVHAAGIGMANNVKGEKKVVMTYFGDGASSEGDTHEALNFASVFKAPVVFTCLNNQYAISVPLHRQMNCQTVAQRAISYGIPGVRVDGNDVLAVYVAAKEAVERARKGEGPTLIEGLTYRYTPHTTSDDPKRYRKEEEAQQWAAKEPLIRFRKYLEKKGILNDKIVTQMEEEIETRIQDAIKNVERMLKEAPYSDPLVMFDYLYADMPPHLQEQRDELAHFLSRNKSDAEKKHETAAH